MWYSPPPQQLTFLHPSDSSSVIFILFALQSWANAPHPLDSVHVAEWLLLNQQGSDQQSDHRRTSFVKRGSATQPLPISGSINKGAAITVATSFNTYSAAPCVQMGHSIESSRPIMAPSVSPALSLSHVARATQLIEQPRSK